MLQAFTRWLYKPDAAVRAFTAEHPAAQVLASGPAKAIRFQPEQDETLRRGPQWAYALRGTLIATPELLEFRLNPRFDQLHDVASGFSEFETFRIAAEEIVAADLLEINGGKGMVVRVRHASGLGYHFGLMTDGDWLRVPFIQGSAAASVGWSRFSVIARLKLAGMIGLLLALLAALCWLGFR